MRFCNDCQGWTSYLKCPVCGKDTEEDPDTIQDREKVVDIKIEPCPFCGAEGVLCGEQSQSLYRDSWSETIPAYWVTAMHKLDCPFGVVVQKSGGYFHPVFATKKEAIDNWNMRAGEKDETNNI